MATPAPTVSRTPRPVSPTRPLPTDTPTPFVFPSPAASPTPPCRNNLPTRLVLLERAIVLDDSSPDERLNIRSGPGTNNPVVGQLAIGELFIVVEGPACSNRYTWYRVLAGEVDGWVAEGDFEEYYVAPYLAE